MLTRPIPSSGEPLPVVGLGSWITFNVGDDPVARDDCAEVMRAFFAAGGRMIDSSPMYGSSQDGHRLWLCKQLGRPRACSRPTRSGSPRARAGRGRSRSRAGIWDVPALRPAAGPQPARLGGAPADAVRDEGGGQLRYVGHHDVGRAAPREIEQIMRSQPIDFVQVTYNVLDREVEQRILPLARERGIASSSTGRSAKAR